MGSSSWNKVVGWSGIAFVLVFVASSGFVADIPPPGDPAVVDWLERREPAIALTTWGGSLALAFLLLFFASGLRTILSAPGDESGDIWTRFAFAGAMTMAILGMAKAIFLAVLSLADLREAVTDQVAIALAGFDSVAVASLVPWGAAAFLIGVSVVILRDGTMPRWVGWLGIVSAAALTIGTLWLFAGDIDGPFALTTLGGYLGFLVFDAAVGVTLVRAPRPAA
jgi:hypothetical protein